MPLATDRARVAASDLFDAAWYCETYPDVSESGLDPLDHYLSYGTLLCRSPGPAFPADFYEKIYGPKVRRRSSLSFYLDPSPPQVRGNQVLKAAHALAAAGNVRLAIDLARQYLPRNLVYTVHSLEMLRHIQHGNRSGWVGSLNWCLKAHRQSPLAIEQSRARAPAILTALTSKEDLPPVTDGPMITVLMSVFNMAGLVTEAARSILNQTWRNLELIIVDDASTDGTWQALSRLAEADLRVRLIRNDRHAGPYACRNLAMTKARGDFVTLQDGGDWAHPERLEKHMAAHLAQEGAPPITTAWAVYLDEAGRPTRISTARSELSSDGFTQRNPVTALIDRSFFANRLGAWDCVTFGGDTELLRRAAHLTGQPVPDLNVLAMLCHDHSSDQSQHPVSETLGNDGQLSDAQHAYLAASQAWLDATPARDVAPFAFPQEPRPFPVPQDLQIGPPALDDVVFKAWAAL